MTYAGAFNYNSNRQKPTSKRYKGLKICWRKTWRDFLDNYIILVLFQTIIMHIISHWFIIVVDCDNSLQCLSILSGAVFGGLIGGIFILMAIIFAIAPQSCTFKQLEIGAHQDASLAKNNYFD